MKLLIKLLTLVLLLSSSLFALSNKNLVISINLAGKQRMLSQKMTKESFLIRSNIDKKENIEKLTKSSQLFNKTLKGLINGESSLQLVAIKDKAIQTQLQEIQKLWTPFNKEIQAIITNKATKSSYNMLETNNIPLLKAMNKVVRLYTLQNKGHKSLTIVNDINLAGKQRMLTQKMGKDLLFISNKFKTKSYQEDFKKSRKLFTQIIQGLFEGSKALKLTGTKLPKITKQLKIVEKLWKEHQPTLDLALKNQEIKKAITGLDTILVEMNKAVIIYTKSLNRQKQRLQLSSIISNFMNKSGILKKKVNLSGRQRMLTQRMTKLALLMRLNIDKKANRKRLIQFSDLYNKTLFAFKSGDKDLGCVPSNNIRVKKQIAVVEKEWMPFYAHVKNIIDGKDKEGKSLEYMITKNEYLLKISNELVKQFESSNKATNYLDKSRLHIVNVAGQQRMLTQKMTKEKLLISEGKSEYGEKIEKTIKLFDDSLNALINGDSKKNIIKPTNKGIKKQLNIVAEIWKKLKPLYEKPKVSKKELDLIIKQNPILLKEMNKAVKMSETSVEY